jgi:ribosome silencing factor RsfS/YbeB/iojap
VPAKRKTSTSKTTGGKRAAANPKPSHKPKATAAAAGAAAGSRTNPKPSRKPKAAAAAAGAAVGSLAKPSLKTTVSDALEDMKALEVKFLDVRGLTDIADCMVIASGTSDRHVRSVAQRVVEKAKEAGFRPHGVEGQQDGDWVLIDLNEMIVHVMLPRVREFYGLEKLWDMTAAKRAARA